MNTPLPVVRLGIVIGAGFMIHWMIPAMPLAVAFALAAIISPTEGIGSSTALFGESGG